MEQMSSREAAWRRPLWMGLLVGVSAVLTTVFACVTPFVAIGVIAAMTLSRGGALWLTVAAWLADQAVGYGVLHYPWTANSVAWGLALGGGAVVATFTARWVLIRLQHVRPSIRALAAFGSAFAVYELGLYALAVSLLGGATGFAPSVVGQVLLVNTVAFLGLYGLNRFADAVGLIGRPAAGVASARRFA